MIKKEGAKWVLYSKDGSKKLGSFDSEKEAQAREDEIQRIKHAKAEIELVITKASLQPDGTMRWQAVASDTEADRIGERTSLSLFQDWINRVGTGKSVSFLPPPRNPFLGVSHYPDLGGAGEAGLTERMYVDGNRFKPSGIYKNTPLGTALFEATRHERELIQKGETIEQPIRISAGWWDLAHSHGDFIFERKSLADKCPMCEAGAGNKIYLKGQLDHFAATRVPINPRTELTLEEKSMAKTKREDAASIVGDELAEELENEATLTGKSETEAPDGMVTKAAMKTVGGKKYPASDFLVVEDSEEPSTWHLQVKRNGKPDHGLMGGAWAALHEGYRGNKYEGPNKSAAISELKKMYASEKMEPPTEKADVERMEDEEYYGPFGGATTLEEADAFLDAAEMRGQLMNNWEMLQGVIQNIMRLDDASEMKAKLQTTMSEFSDRIDALKSALSDAYLLQPTGDEIMAQTQNQQQTSQPVQVATLDAAMEQMKAALATPGDRNAKLQAAQTALENAAQALKAEVDRQAPPDPTEAIIKAFTPMVERMDLLLAKLGAGAPQQHTPQQKSFTPQQVQQSQVANPGGGLPVSPVTGKPSGLTAMIRKSVGAQ